MLAAYAECGIVSAACKAAEVGRTAHYEWLKSDQDYAAAFAEAHTTAVESMEREARRRAMEGWEEPVFYKGDECGYVRKFSDTLLIFMLKGANPETYRERFEQHFTGKVEQVVSGSVSIRALLEEQEYVDFLRQRTGYEDCDAGALCQIRESGNGKPLANGSAYGGPGPGTNGHRNGSE